MKVFCRFAPVVDKRCSTQRLAEGHKLHISIDHHKVDHGASLTVADTVTGVCLTIGCGGAFLPDDPTATQSTVFNTIVPPLLERVVIHGEPCALMAYGQTSTGKTHTMFGPDGGNSKYFGNTDDQGLVPRIANSLFQMTGVKYVEVSCFEVYNETVTDLVGKFVTENQNVSAPLSSSASSSKKIVFKSTEKRKIRRLLQKVVCSNGAQCLELIGNISEARQCATTDHNKKSSRAHTLLLLHIYCDGRTNPATLTLVDLAGSESLKGSLSSLSTTSTFEAYSAKSSGKTISQENATRNNEMRNINTSLFALKKVVHQLKTLSNRSSQGQLGINPLDGAFHIPFNDSVLTAVLQECLASSFTVLVACCSPLQKDSAETIATIRFAQEASQILPSLLFAQHRMKEFYSLSTAALVPPPTDKNVISRFADDVTCCLEPLPTQSRRIHNSTVVQLKPTIECGSRSGDVISSVSQLLDRRNAPPTRTAVAQPAESLESTEDECDDDHSSQHEHQQDETMDPLSCVNHALEREVAELREELSHATAELDESRCGAKRLMVQCGRLASSYDTLVLQLEEAKQIIKEKDRELRAVSVEVSLLRNHVTLQTAVDQKENVFPSTTTRYDKSCLSLNAFGKSINNETRDVKLKESSHTVLFKDSTNCSAVEPTSLEEGNGVESQAFRSSSYKKAPAVSLVRV